MNERLDYTVTERAGRRVAGRVVSPGDTLSLTSDEADYELREGTIVRKGRSTAVPAKSASADRARAEAAEVKSKAKAQAEGSSSPAAPEPSAPTAV